MYELTKKECMKNNDCRIPWSQYLVSVLLRNLKIQSDIYIWNKNLKDKYCYNGLEIKVLEMKSLFYCEWYIDSLIRFRDNAYGVFFIIE